MAAIEAIVFVAAAGFAVIVVLTVIVVIGVRQEERYKTLEQRTAPSAVAQLARIVLGRYVRREDYKSSEHGYPDDRNGSRDRRVGPRS
jgi:hypothetical protein